MRIEKYEAGAFDVDQEAANALRDHQAKIAALERKVGQLTMELDILKGAALGAPAEKRAFLDRQRPEACSVSEGCRLMRLARSTYYHRVLEPHPEAVRADAELRTRMREICAEFPRCGYRRVTAQLRVEGRVINHKKVARLIREEALQVRPRRRFGRTTDSDHDGPVFPDRAKTMAPRGPDQLWVADITYIRIVAGFVYR